MSPEHASRRDEPCPGQAEWTGFLLGEIVAVRQHDLSRHLEACPACLALVGTIADVDDGMADALRRPLPVDPLLEDPAYLRFQSRALALARGGEAEGEAEGFRDGPGRTLGRFILREKVGSGGYGVVWRAFDDELGREVALKVPHGHALLDPEARDRFIHEARTAARLSHPNILPVLDAGRVEDVPYIVMEFCHGPNLGEWQRGRTEPVPARRAAGLTAALAGAVATAHEAGILHRDIKPTNILLFPSQAGGGAGRDDFAFIPRLADFGVAKLWLDAATRPDVPRTATGAMVGTPEYMAPEQAAGQGRKLDPRVDVWALGALLYHLLTGRPPFQGESPIQTLKLVVEQEPAAPRLLRPGLSRDLETIVLKCLAKQPGDRYESARALADDLDRWLEGRPIHARPISPLGRAWRSCRRRPGIASLAAALFLSMTVGLAVASVFWFRAESSRRSALGYFEITSRHLDELVQSASLPAASWDRSVRDTLTRAGTTYRELLKRRPGDRQVRMTLARIDHQLALRELRRYRPGPCLPLLEEASRLADGLLAEAPADQELRVWACEVRVDLGVALWEREDLPGAIRLCEETCRMLEPLREASGESRARVVLARARRQLGFALIERGDTSSGLRLVEESGVELVRWLERNPDDAAAIRSVYVHCSSVAGSGRNPRVDHRLGESTNDLGLRVLRAWWVSGQMYRASSPEEARICARVEVGFLEPVLASLSRAASRIEDPGFLWCTSRLEENLAVAYELLGRHRDAEPLSEQALRHSLELILHNEADEFEAARWLIDASVRHVRRMMSRTAEPSDLEASVAYLSGVYLGVGVKSNRPDIWQANLAHAIALLGASRRIDARRLDQSDELNRRAFRILDPLSGRLSGDPTYQLAISEVWTQVGKNRSRGDDPLATRAALRHAADAARAAFRLEPDQREDLCRGVYDNRLARLARFDIGERRFLEAEATLEERAGLWEGNGDQFRELAQRFRELAGKINPIDGSTTDSLRQCRERCLRRAEAFEKQAGR